jgi:DNA polymerase-1
MAQIIQTATFDRATASPSELLWVYNGLDCVLTYEIKQEMMKHLQPESQVIYNFERGLQAPALELMLRGVQVDPLAKMQHIQEFLQKIDKLEHILNQFSEAAWGRTLNPNSPKQVADFFYNHMKLPLVTARNKQTGKVGPDTSRAAMEKLSMYFYARPFINLILAIKEYKKKVATLRSGVDSDGKMRVSYNVAGTETGRWSSNKNAFGGGMNFQNLTEALRDIFTSDPGKKMCYMDLEQAESRGVAYLSKDEAYIEACEGGDLHTTVCRMVWRKLPWTGVLKHDKNAIAGQVFYMHFTYRDMAKRGGHGTNYYGQAFTMAKHLKVETGVMEEFQEDYFQAFPGIPEWHKNIISRVQLEGAITTPLQRKRIFFGRRTDDSTTREAIAFEPQATIGDSLNLGLWRVWKHGWPQVQILGQVHDAILFQYAEEIEAEAIASTSELLRVDIPIHGKVMVIPNEAQVGWNWKHYDPLSNPDGIKNWNKEHGDDRKRTGNPKASLLDYKFS